MENLIVAILLYVAIVAIAYRPKTAATDPAAPIDYFPEVEATTEPEPVAMPVQPAIAATALTTVPTMATAQPDPVQSFTVANDLSRLGVRDLYKLASKAGIKGYKKLTKPQLVQALA
ncbi:hypothetical protein [Synechocystis salina]|uniref:Rho termination factor N-terminal domain-containing protein n=1 Tax=Synechocystis salina LEGE 00031 TaxID=1828736 RepID=A0ABR9VXD3_9SYNC|nr:hypothetical protein [Synechocystis salina]MBE9242689.1 hypothetical protein [Synechocystis salina LEGE 00041]MBE9255686.1 hypothetical protein [Synechocystis salina LEGE 00031]